MPRLMADARQRGTEIGLWIAAPFWHRSRRTLSDSFLDWARPEKGLEHVLNKTIKLGNSPIGDPVPPLGDSE